MPLGNLVIRMAISCLRANFFFSIGWPAELETESWRRSQLDRPLASPLQGLAANLFMTPKLASSQDILRQNTQT